MNNSINMLSPFVLYCQKVIPLAFDESMSYYECLCALYSYLKEQVVPAVNSNAEALEEVQKAMVELKDYVDHYFDNLDIQTEIDNKLDEMADSGELAQIIAQYLEMSFIFGFDTIADLKAGDNFVAGNIVRVLGKTSYATGDGAFYRVRALTVYDTIDDDLIVGLTNYPSLVAEKITDYYIDEINETLDELTYYNSKFTQNVINNSSQKVLFAGDSYTYGEDPDTELQVVNPFPKLVQDIINDWYGSTIVQSLNYGVKGAIASAGNTNFSTYLAQSPDVIFWAYGTNDVTQGRTNNQIIADLDTFYNSCVSNNIELIVIIPPINFGNLARKQGMYRLHQALLNYVIKKGILYIDMFKYINNLYDTNSTTHDVLQPDLVHFSDYSVFSDAIISQMLPIVYKQKNDLFSYIQIDNTPNYVQSNITVVDIANNLSIFDKGLVMFSADGNTFKMKFLVTKPSYLIFNGYCNSSAGRVVFTIDTTDYTVDEYYNVAGSESLDQRYNYKFPVVLKAGLHTITIKSVTFDSGSITRFYMFGFTLEEKTTSMSENGFYKLEDEIIGWSGNTATLSDVSLSKSLTSVNTIKILVGNSLDNFAYIEIHPNTLTRNFYENYTTKAPVVWNNTVGIMTIIVNTGTNSISISSTNNAPVRRIYMYSDINWRQ